MHLDQIRVSHDGLDRAADGLHAGVRRIDERLDRLDAELTPLRIDWTGQAQQAYLAAKQKWEGAIREMRDLLETTSRTVTESNGAYRAADQRGAASFEL